MSYRAASDNGTNVNMIKQKFEQNASTKENRTQRLSREVCAEPELKDSLRRSLSASPVKCKRNLKWNVSRQLSNPGRNIKRTPAFRGDKFSRTKNLQSVSKDEIVSIVDRNVRMFEEKPEYGKIACAKEKGSDMPEKKKSGETLSEQRVGSKKNGENCENTVRTTVISRQKNISPIYRLDRQDLENRTSSRLSEDGDRVRLDPSENVRFEKFYINGAEYTEVTKRNKPSVRSDSAKRLDIANDIEKEDGSIEQCRKVDRSNDTSSEHTILNVKLTDTLRAALRAPLPAGPPPKKPPRTFAHSRDGAAAAAGGAARSNMEFTKKRNEVYDGATSQSDEDSSRVPNRRVNDSLSKIESKTAGEEEVSTKFDGRETRDSRKMLEKLEHVLTQHQRALGPKVMTARGFGSNSSSSSSTSSASIGSDVKETAPLMSDFRGSPTSDTADDREKRIFRERLSRTLESVETKPRKHSTFDCLPSLNCASRSAYNQIKNRNFKSHLAVADRPSFLRESKNSISKSEDSLRSSHATVTTSFSSTAPISKSSLSSELSTFLLPDSGTKRPIMNKTRSEEERVYAEPFAFDQNSGTDIITAFGLSSPEEHNYFSRSLGESRFADSRDNTISGSKVQARHEPSCSVNRVGNAGNPKPELHYMCTSVQPFIYKEDNNNEPEDKSGCSQIQRPTIGSSKHALLNSYDEPAQSESDGFNEIKVQQLLNRAFGEFSAMAGAETLSDSNASSDTDSLASGTAIESGSGDNDGERLSSFSDKIRLFETREKPQLPPPTKPSKDELHRSLTEKRKNYVRRVSSKYSERRDGGNCGENGRNNKLFEVCLLVELNLSTREPYIKDKYPVYATTPAWIESFCFPDASDWPPSDSNHNQQFYSLVLTDERGSRRYGYCCRVKPEGGPILPLAYCLITKCRASGFYQKVLLELESRHGQPDRRRRSFIEELYNSPLPKPGQSLRITSGDENRAVVDGWHRTREDGNGDSLPSRFAPTALNNETKESSVIALSRSGDPRLEERDMSQLFDAVTNKVLIILFASLLLERKVVLVCGKLSKLSSCVEALQSLLYPFTWPHTFIPVLPDIPGISEILQAPLPFVIGVLKSKKFANTEVASVRDGIVVDLDTSKIVCAVGDESSILPSRLQKGIRSALELVSGNTKNGDGIRNFLVSEAFMRVFVETCSHCDSYLVTQQDGKVIFQKDSFVKAASSKTVRYFLEWFVETTMLIAFVQDRIASMEGTTAAAGDGERNHCCSCCCCCCDVKLFRQRVAEYRQAVEKNAQEQQPKRSCVKKKTLGDRLKDLTNFHA